MKNFRINNFILAGSVFLICLAVMLLAPESNDLLRYHRGDIVNHHQWWRLFTANFCHIGWNHWLLNMGGLLLIDYFYQPLVSQAKRAALLLFCIVFNLLLLHWLVQVDNYVGLSGALHGFLLGCALVSFKRAKWVNLIIILTVIIKLASELIWPVNQFTEKFIQANILEESHLFGALCGVVFFVIDLTAKKISAR